VSDLLREIRAERGESIREVARNLGVDPSYLSRTERGEKPLSASVRDRLAAHYDVHPDVLRMASNEVPLDVVEILRRHPEAIGELRERYGSDATS
jgi:transcriptional regulator with XRE-family HTH domain